MSKSKLIKHLLKKLKKQKQQRPTRGMGIGGSGEGGVKKVNGKFASEDLKKTTTGQHANKSLKVKGDKQWTDSVPKKKPIKVRVEPTKRPAREATLKATTSHTEPSTPAFKEAVKAHRRATLSKSRTAGAKMMKQRIVKKSPAKINNVLAKKPRPPKRPKM